MSGIRIRPAQPREAPALSALALRSKAHWGYDQAFLVACIDDLTVDPKDCDGERLIVAEFAGTLAGFAQLAGSPPAGELLNLWVDPAYMGHGIGRQLFETLCNLARSLGFRKLTIDSDPHAEAFYRHMGSIRIGEAQSTVDPERALPLLEITL